MSRLTADDGIGFTNDSSSSSAAAAVKSGIFKENGGACSLNASTSKYFSLSNGSAFTKRTSENNASNQVSTKDNLSNGIKLNNNLPPKFTDFTPSKSNSTSSILNSSIQFMASKRASVPDLKELKQKYIHLSMSQQPIAKSTNGGVKIDGISAYPTKALLNGQNGDAGNSKARVTEITQPVAAIISNGLPPPLFDIFPADGIRLQWDSSFRCSTSVGLNNLGNTCFLNSVLQVLTNTAPLVNYLLGNEHDARKCPASVSSNFCALCTMKSHIIRVLNAANSFHDTISPSIVAGKIRNIMKSHAFGRQEDAHEFLRYFIDAMQAAALFPYKDQKLDLFTKETSVISRIFGGYHKNEIVCNNCHASSVTYDPFLDLNVEIKQSDSLETALAHFTRVETLASDNAYLCPKCNRRVSAKKIFTIYQPPNILTVQLKRFDHFGKIDRLITYPERLNLRPYMTERQGPPVNYKLYGVIVHVGRTTHSGHYYAFARNHADQWHLLDDSRVSTVAANTATRTSAAYVLFYIRLATPIASVKPQAKPPSRFIGPQRPPSNGVSVSEKIPAPRVDLTQLFKPTFQTEARTPHTPVMPPTMTNGSAKPTFNGSMTKPVVQNGKLTPLPARGEPIKIHLAPRTMGDNMKNRRPPILLNYSKSMASTLNLLKSQTTKPIQDSSISSSTKLVPYEDEEDDEDGEEKLSKEKLMVPMEKDVNIGLETIKPTINAEEVKMKIAKETNGINTESMKDVSVEKTLPVVSSTSVVETENGADTDSKLKDGKMGNELIDQSTTPVKNGVFDLNQWMESVINDPNSDRKSTTSISKGASNSSSIDCKTKLDVENRESTHRSKIDHYESKYSNEPDRYRRRSTERSIKESKDDRKRKASDDRSRSRIVDNDEKYSHVNVKRRRRSRSSSSDDGSIKRSRKRRRSPSKERRHHKHNGKHRRHDRRDRKSESSDDERGRSKKKKKRKKKHGKRADSEDKERSRRRNKSTTDTSSSEEWVEEKKIYDYMEKSNDYGNRLNERHSKDAKSTSKYSSGSSKRSYRKREHEEDDKSRKSGDLRDYFPSVFQHKRS